MAGRHLLGLVDANEQRDRQARQYRLRTGQAGSVISADDMDDIEEASAGDDVLVSPLAWTTQAATGDCFHAGFPQGSRSSTDRRRPAMSLGWPHAPLPALLEETQAHRVAVAAYPYMPRVEYRQVAMTGGHLHPSVCLITGGARQHNGDVSSIGGWSEIRISITEPVMGRRPAGVNTTSADS